MLKTIETLKIVALLAFILCCVSWLIHTPGRYQLLHDARVFDTARGQVVEP